MILLFMNTTSQPQQSWLPAVSVNHNKITKEIPGSMKGIPKPWLGEANWCYKMFLNACQPEFGWR